jgi:hypothetical protein
MPYRDRAQVAAWLDDFLEYRPDLAERLSIVDQDFVASDDSGIVVVSLRKASTLTYIRPTTEDGHPMWATVFEARSTTFTLGSEGLRELAADVNDLAAICEYLQERTDRHVV